MINKNKMALTIPCVALVALEEKLDKEDSLEVIDRWMNLGLKVDCMGSYPGRLKK